MISGASPLLNETMGFLKVISEPLRHMLSPVCLLLPLDNFPPGLPVEANQLAVHGEHRLRLGLANVSFQRFQNFGVVRRQAAGLEVTLFFAGHHAPPSVEQLSES
jgi:hypothetical protein